MYFFKCDYVLLYTYFITVFPGGKPWGTVI